MYKKIIFAFAVLCSALTVATFTVYAAGGFGLEGTAKEAGYETAKSPTAQTAETVQMVVTTILGFVAIVFFGLTLLGGFIWLTARGKEEKVEEAKNILEAAIIGLVIIAASYAVSTFVLSRISGDTEGMVCYCNAEEGIPAYCLNTADETQCAASKCIWQQGPCPAEQ